MTIPREVPIQVVVRVRPFVRDEVKTNPYSCLYCLPDKPQLVVGKDRSFTFDEVFSEDASQTKIFNSYVQPLSVCLFEGYNATVFAYGQTGSGKTYTMGTGRSSYFDDDESGMIPRAIYDIFDRKKNLEGEVICKMKVSFIEIYMEDATDLLTNSSQNLHIREDEYGNTVVAGLTEESTETPEEVLNLLDAGTALRHVGMTNMNDASSRSHCIFSLSLEQYPLNAHSLKGKVLSSQFHFVDLAGSERVNRTGNQGNRFKESVFINTGLLALGNVISALSDPKRRGQHVPYRESKLTRLLKDSLGGNSRTVMITCLSPALADLDENINSLKYATRAKLIKNTPVLNWDMERLNINQMESTIIALQDQLRKNTMARETELEVENERYDSEQNSYFRCYLEANVILQLIQVYCPLPDSLQVDIDRWRVQWGEIKHKRPITAPVRKSSPYKLSDYATEKLRTDLLKCQEKLASVSEHLAAKTKDFEEVNSEVIQFGEENALLRLELDKAVNKALEFKECLLEHQMNASKLKSGRGEDFHGERLVKKDDPVLQRFRAKNEVLISQIDELEVVRYDDHITSDEEEHVINRWEAKQANVFRTKRLSSNIPKLINGYNPNKRKAIYNGFQREESGNEMLKVLESGRESARLGAKESERHGKEFAKRMNDLQLNIKQKEDLINELLVSEKQAQAMSLNYREKLQRIEKEYERSKYELEETKVKIEQCADSKEVKNRLESEYKKNLKAMQKKFDDLKQKECVSDRLTRLQENKEKKIKELEASLGRVKNQHNDMERKLKAELEKKNLFEQEMHKNELRIKELEVKTNQQQKMLKRKNEEVVAAQRKLRNAAGVSGKPGSEPSELDRKQVWINNEIEKIVSRQQTMDLLEAELEERDESLKKKEALLLEKRRLEDKKNRPNQNLSESIMKLSVQMESIDEQIHRLTVPVDSKRNNMQQLLSVKEELTNQKEELERAVEECGGLNPAERRRLIELDEAVEAVDEAINFKSELISRSQRTIDHELSDRYHNIEHLIKNMGDLSRDEYKHLLGMLFLKIIELRRRNNEADDARCHLEIKIREQEKIVQDLERTLHVMKTRYEIMFSEQNQNYEKDTQFFMNQLHEAEDRDVKSKCTKESDKRIEHLEKELYYYKVQSKKYRDQLKDFVRNPSIDTENGKSTAKSGDEFRLPPVQDYPIMARQPYSEETKRIQHIFESKAQSSTDRALRSSKKSREMVAKKKQDSEFKDSIDSKS